MRLDAGIATICRGQNTAQNGEMPNIQYNKKIFESYYAEKTVGVTRFRTAQANNVRADVLIEIQRCGAITTEDICTVQAFDDAGISGTYKIVQVQNVWDENGLQMTDLTLQRIEPIEEADDGD